METTTTKKKKEKEGVKPKEGYVFPREEILALIETSTTQQKDTSSRVVAAGDDGAVKEACAQQAALVAEQQTKNPIKIGVFAAELRKADQVFASIALTKQALFLGWYGVKQFSDMEVQQIPSPFYVPATNPTGGDKHHSWQYASSSSINPAREAGLLALTPVSVTWIPYSDAEADKWIALGCDGGASIFANKDRVHTFFSQQMCELLDTCTATKTILLLSGDLFITRRGTPFYLSSSGENYIVQSVAGEIVPATTRRKPTWKNILEKGSWKNGTFGEQVSARLAPTRSKKDAAPYTPLFPLALFQDVEWLVGKNAVVKKPAATSSTSPGGSPTIAVGNLYARHDQLKARIAQFPSKNERTFEVPVTWSDASEKVEENRIKNKSVHVVSVWKQQDEQTANNKRVLLETTEKSGAKVLASKVNEYQTALDKLEEIVKETEANMPQFDKVKRELQQAVSILAGMVLPEDAKAQILSRQALMKSFCLFLEEKTHNILKKTGEVSVFLAKCTEFEKQAAARVQKLTAPAAAKEEELVLPVIDENALEEMRMAGSELDAYLDKVVNGKDKMIFTMVHNMSNPALKQFYDTFKLELQLALDAQTDAKELSENLEFDVRIIDAYLRALIHLYDQKSAAKRSIAAAAGPTSSTKRRTIVCGGRDGCGKRRREYADNQCEECYVSLLRERIIVFDELEKKFRNDAKKNHALRKETNTETPTELETKYKQYLDKVHKLQKLIPKHEDAPVPIENLPKILALLKECQDLIVSVYPDKKKYFESGGGRKKQSLDVDDDDMDIDDDEEEYDEEEEEEEEAVSFADDDDDDDDDEIELADDNDEEPEFSSSSPPLNAGKRLKKRGRNSDNEEEDDSGPSTRQLRLAHRILKAERRTPIDKDLTALKAWYDKADDASLAQIEARLIQLEALSALYVVQPMNGATTTKYVFAEQDHAQDRLELLRLQHKDIKYELIENLL